MTKDDVIRLAEQCGIDPHDMCEDPRIAVNNLEAFAKLVAEHERMRFSEECIDLVASYGGPVDLEAAIRAR